MQSAHSLFFLRKSHPFQNYAKGVVIYNYRKGEGTKKKKIEKNTILSEKSKNRVYNTIKVKRAKEVVISTQINGKEVYAPPKAV